MPGIVLSVCQNRLRIRLLKNVFPLFLLFALWPIDSHALKFSSVFWQLGKIDLTSKIEKNVVVFNDGGKEAEVSARPTCDCLEVIPKKVSIPPADKRSFRIIFDPSGFKGKVRHSIYFETTDKRKPFFNYYVEADVNSSFSLLGSYGGLI